MRFTGIHGTLGELLYCDYCPMGAGFTFKESNECLENDCCCKIELCECNKESK